MDIEFSVTERVHSVHYIHDTLDVTIVIREEVTGLF